MRSKKKYTTSDFISYVVTGFLYNTDKRFKPIRTSNWKQAKSINLWKGKIWGIKHDGRRILIISVP